MGKVSTTHMAYEKTHVYRPFPTSGTQRRLLKRKKNIPLHAIRPLKVMVALDKKFPKSNQSLAMT